MSYQGIASGDRSAAGEIATIIVTPHEWEAVFATAEPCPAFACRNTTRYQSIWRLIPHLNDDHRWSRQAIAEWVEAIERGILQSHLEEQDFVEMDFSEAAKR